MSDVGQPERAAEGLAPPPVQREKFAHWQPRLRFQAHWASAGVAGKASVAWPAQGQQQPHPA